MLIFLIVLVIMLLLDLCCTVEYIVEKCKKEYYITIIREMKEKESKENEMELKTKRW